MAQERRGHTAAFRRRDTGTLAPFEEYEEPTRDKVKSLMQRNKLNTPSSIESSAEERVRSRIRHDFVPTDSNWDHYRVREVEDRVLKLIKLYCDQRSTSGDIRCAVQELGRSVETSPAPAAAVEVSQNRKI